MNIYFIGTVEFSYFALEAILEIKEVKVVGVSTRESSVTNADFKSLVPLCEANNIPYKFVKNVNTVEHVEWIQSLNSNVIFCFGWSNLLKIDILNCTDLGVVGYHPSALPLNRGRHPLIWAIVLGLKKTASTFFFMDEGADSGDIISQEEFEIHYEDYAIDVYNRIIKLSKSQIKSFVPQLANGTFRSIKQNHLKANVWRKRGLRDGIINFNSNSRTIYNLIRGLSNPYVGACIMNDGFEVKVWKSKEHEVVCENIEPGKVIDVKDKDILVKTYDGGIWLIEHEFEEIPKIGEYL